MGGGAAAEVAGRVPSALTLVEANQIIINMRRVVLLLLLLLLIMI